MVNMMGLSEVFIDSIFVIFGFIYDNMDMTESENRVKASTRSVQSLGQLLLQGYCMLADGCAECMVRMFVFGAGRIYLKGVGVCYPTGYCVFVLN
jgi:hypothetical protein